MWPCKAKKMGFSREHSLDQTVHDSGDSSYRHLTAYSVERFDISFFDIILSEATTSEPNNSIATMIWSTVENWYHLKKVEVAGYFLRFLDPLP